MQHALLSYIRLILVAGRDELRCDSMRKRRFKPKSGRSQVVLSPVSAQHHNPALLFQAMSWIVPLPLKYSCPNKKELSTMQEKRGSERHDWFSYQTSRLTESAAEQAKYEPDTESGEILRDSVGTKWNNRWKQINPIHFDTLVWSMVNKVNGLVSDPCFFSWIWNCVGACYLSSNSKDSKHCFDRSTMKQFDVQCPIWLFHGSQLNVLETPLKNMDSSISDESDPVNRLAADRGDVSGRSASWTQDLLWKPYQVISLPSSVARGQLYNHASWNGKTDESPWFSTGKRDKGTVIEMVSYNVYNQRKLGSNTSVLRTNRTVRLDIDEGRCETWHHITIHHKRIIGYDTGWWRRAVVT